MRGQSAAAKIQIQIQNILTPGDHKHISACPKTQNNTHECSSHTHARAYPYTQAAHTQARNAHAPTSAPNISLTHRCTSARTGARAAHLVQRLGIEAIEEALMCWHTCERSLRAQQPSKTQPTTKQDATKSTEVPVQSRSRTGRSSARRRRPPAARHRERSSQACHPHSCTAQVGQTSQ